MNSNSNTIASLNCDRNSTKNDVFKSSINPINDIRSSPMVSATSYPITKSNSNLKNDQKSSLRYFVSGLTGGVLATTTLHPLDVIKIRLAVNDGRSSTKRVYLGLRNAFKTIWVEEGVRGYYRGLVPNSLGAGLSWGLYFLFYNELKKSHASDPKKREFIFSQSLIAASEAGVLTLMLTNPIWVIKTRLCLQYGSNVSSLTNQLPPEKQYSGMIDAFAKTYRTEGIKGLYSGFFPGVLNVTHGAIQFSIYEKLKNWHKKKHNFDTDSQIGLDCIFYFSVISKICAATITYPLQVIRARLQDQHGNYKSFRDAVVTTYRISGFVGFYSGALAQLLHMLPNIVIVLSVHEFFQSL